MTKDNENFSTGAEKKCKKKASAHKIKNLTKMEVERLFKTIKDHGSFRDLVIFHISYYCGLRISEVGSLTRSAWDDSAGVLNIYRLKGSLPSQCFLDSTRAALLRKYLKGLTFDSPYDPLFPSRHRAGVGKSLLHKLMKKYSALAKIPQDLRHFHVLKHSIAVHLLDSMADIKDVQHHLGHADIKNTLIYAKYSSARSRKFQKLIRKSNYIGR